MLALCLLAPAASAWYGPFVFVSPSSATVGGQVNAQGISFSKADPVQARLDTLDGPVLATFTPKSGSHSLEFQGPITVPTETKPGNHVLVFTQYDAAGNLEQMPIRALVAVASVAGGAPVVGAPFALDTTARTPALVQVRHHPLSAGALVLIAFGVAGIGMLVASTVALAGSRQAHGPARVRG
jgi:hypothetical protein